MKRNSLLQKTLGNHVELYRILDIQGEKVFVIDCLKANMPKWVAMEHLEGFEDCEESVLYELSNYLCLYLVYQDISALAPKAKEEKELTDDEKKMRYAINKYYFSKNKNSLNTAFTMMLQNQYCDQDKRINLYPCIFFL